MKIRIKLYAMLAQYLPSGAEKNEADIELAEGASVQDALSSRHLPDEYCHLERRANRVSRIGDSLVE